MLYTCVYNSVLGNIKISADEKSILTVSFTNEAVNFLNKNEIIDKTILQLNEYFERKRRVFDLEINLKGTDFQKRVWNELLKIPYGETRTYKDIAIKIENEKSYRAIGNACNKNPVAIIIPCHRVIGKDNKIVGYAFGKNLKKSLLYIETKNKKFLI